MKDQINYQNLAIALLEQSSHKAVSGTPSTNWAHGPGGVASYPGLSPQIFNAMMLPHLGLQRMLPIRRSNEMNPLYGILTGVTAASGSNPEDVCDDFPTAGLAQLCQHTAAFGRIGMQTEVVNIDRAGQTTNRGEFLDLQLIGNPVSNGAGVPTIDGQSAAGALNDERQKKLFELASNWATKYAPLLYTGNPSNNTAGGGYQEYHGLESLINTGYIDAVTRSACPAADSIVLSYGDNLISSSSSDIVGLIQDTVFRLRHIAARASLGEVTWALSMPLGMFYRLTEAWAYYYITRALDGLTFNSAVQVGVSGADVTATRDAMRGNLTSRTGQFLLIDGQRIPVVLDDSIPEIEISAGVFSSDIYIVPLTVRGGSVPVTYMEYVNFDVNGGAMDTARKFAPDGHFYTTDSGTYLWARKPPTNLCVQLMGLAYPRLILRTPYLAARISNVAWAPLTQHERSPFTTSAYFAGGGNTDLLGYGPSFAGPTS